MRLCAGDSWVTPRKCCENQRQLPGFVPSRTPRKEYCPGFAQGARHSRLCWLRQGLFMEPPNASQRAYRTPRRAR